MIAKIREIMESKKSNICLSLDYTKSSQILDAITILKDHIIMVKLHCDIIEDFSQEFINNLVKICKQSDILIFEDRKFADIGNTFKHQFTSGIFKIREWADIITLHGLVGEGQISQFNHLRREGQYALLVAQMSNRGNLLDDEYTRKMKELAEKNKDTVLGLICQEKLLDNNFLHFTPGIKLKSKTDSCDQQYKSPGEAIQKGSDILIIGRGIINSDNILQTCREYQTEAWKHFLYLKELTKSR